MSAVFDRALALLVCEHRAGAGYGQGACDRGVRAYGITHALVGDQRSANLLQRYCKHWSGRGPRTHCATRSVGLGTGQENIAVLLHH